MISCTEQPETGTKDGSAKYRKRQIVMFIAGLLAVIMGFSVMAFFVGRKLWREWKKHKLMQENVVIEIAALHIKAPVMEGTEQEILAQAAGHFPGTGAPGYGNYCIAGHSSVLYKEYFNNLKSVQTGMEIQLYDEEKTCFTYLVGEYFIVEPNETWILKDFGDDRVTVVTCTDDGTQRLVVVGYLEQPAETQS